VLHSKINAMATKVQARQWDNEKKAQKHGAARDAPVPVARARALLRPPGRAPTPRPGHGVMAQWLGPLEPKH
jgi:hypothetical protein